MVRSTPRLARLALAVVCSIFPAIPHAADAPPPTPAFGQIPDFKHLALSPDGQTILVDRATENGPQVIFLRPGQPRPLRVLNVGTGISLRGLRWADNDTALIEVSTTTHVPGQRSAPNRTFEFFRTMAADIAGGEPRILLLGDGNRDLVTGAELLAANPLRKDTVSMASWEFVPEKRMPAVGTRLRDSRGDDGWVMTLFDVDTKSGRGRVVARGSAYTFQWMVSPDGRPLARSEWNPETRESTILLMDGITWRPIFKAKGIDPLSLAGVTADGKAVVAIGENGTANSRAWALPFDGSPAFVAFEESGVDVNGAAVAQDTGVVTGYWLSGLNPRLVYVDPKNAALERALEKAFPDRSVYIVDRSTDSQRLLVETETSMHPSVYYLVDRTAHKADIVGEAYPALNGAQLGEVRKITYDARDGTRIPAFLTLPPGKGDKDLPLVVLVHGGPESSDPGGFDWWAQFLATRGYAVLQPQFRGSTGYGTAHRLAGYRQWGALMQDDVTDGVRHLIATGVANAKHVCIMGASYGGYAALAGAAFTPDLYACAVSVNGVSDLPQMIGDVRSKAGSDSNSLAYWKDHIGSPGDPNVLQASPARAATAIEAAILLIHGDEDTVVPAKQSQTMAQALDTAGKPYEYVKLAGEDHWLSSGKTRTQLLQTIEAFLAKHL